MGAFVKCQRKNAKSEPRSAAVSVVNIRNYQDPVIAAVNSTSTIGAASPGTSGQG